MSTETTYTRDEVITYLEKRIENEADTADLYHKMARDGDLTLINQKRARGLARVYVSYSQIRQSLVYDIRAGGLDVDD